MSWTLFVFTGGNKGWRSFSVFPSHLLVFIDEPYNQAAKTFLSKEGFDPDDGGFVYFEGNSMEAVWDKAKSEENLSVAFELDEILQLEEAVVYGDRGYQSSSGGMICSKCGQLYPYANGPNQPDGTFKCYGCRVGF